MRHHRHLAVILIVVSAFLTITTTDTEGANHPWPSPGASSSSLSTPGTRPRPTTVQRKPRPTLRTTAATSPAREWNASRRHLTPKSAPASPVASPPATTPSPAPSSLPVSVAEPSSPPAATIQAATPSSDLYAAWQRVATCEEGGANIEGSTFSGYFGISNVNWAAYGGLAYAPDAYGATFDEQAEIGMRITGGVVPDGPPEGCRSW